MQLIHALEYGLQVVGLVGRHRACQAIQKERDVLVNAGQRSAQLVRHVGQELVLEFELLLLRDLERAQKPLPFHRVADGSLQVLAGNVAFEQIVLHSLMHCLHGQGFVVLAGKHNYGHVRSVIHHTTKGFGAAAVGQVQVQQHDGGRFFG